MSYTAFAAVPVRWIIVSESFQHLLLFHDFFETGSSPHLSFTTRAPKEPSPSLAAQSEMKMASASGKISSPNCDLAHPMGTIAETRCRFSLEAGNGSADQTTWHDDEVPEARENLSCCLSMCPQVSNMKDSETCHVVKLSGGFMTCRIGHKKPVCTFLNW